MEDAIDESRIDLAGELLRRFVERTGVRGDAPPRRYLWTDAFAVCGLLGGAREESGPDDELAIALVDQVHHVLGRHRRDDPRTGWLSGLDEEEGERHPTRGGLRIGKELPERGPDEPPDPRLEWDRDGQYFHYLTRWMHALERTSEETGLARFHLWARELAVTAHGAFTHGAGPRRRMVWKMSTDLTRPLVPSMGHHDPLEALVTYLDLQTARPRTGEVEPLPDLSREISEAEAMCRGRDWSTDDPLGIGGLLIDTYRVARMVSERGLEREQLLHRLLDDARSSLSAFVGSRTLQQPAELRLGFRELGLSLGLRAVARAAALDLPPEASARLEPLRELVPLADDIEDVWADPGSRESRAWKEHRDINDVMLATSLHPDGYLGR